MPLQLKRLLLLLLCCTLNCAAALCANIHYFEKLSPAGGFAYGAINTITSDHNGMIWFGADNGLYAHNNNGAVKYTTSKGTDGRDVAIKQVNKLIFDSNHGLWIACDSEIHYFDLNKGTIEVVFQNNKPGRIIYDFVAYGKDQYIFSLDYQIFLLSADRSISNIFTKNLEQITSIAVDEDQKIFMGTGKGALLVGNIEDSTTRQYYSRPNVEISTIHLANDKIYIGYKHAGFEVVSAQGKLLQSYSSDQKGTARYIPSDNVNSIVTTPQGVLYVASEGGGLAIYDGLNSEYIDSSNSRGLPHDSIFSLYLDPENQLYLGTWAGGLAYANENCYYFEQVKDIHSSSGGVVSSFEPKDANTMWVGSEQSGLKIFNIKENRYSRRILNIPVKTMTQDSKQRLWIGTIDKGLYLIDDHQEARHVDVEPLDRDKYVISDLSIDNNTLYISTHGNGLIEYDIESGRAKSLYEMGDDRPNVVWQTETMTNGDLLLCSEKGVHIKAKGEERFRNFYFDKDDVNNNICFSLLQRDSTSFYIGTSRSGVMIFDTEQGEFTPFEHSDEFGHADIYTIQRDSGDNIWFSTNVGLYSYNTQTKHLHHYSVSDGIDDNTYTPLSGGMNGNYMFWGGVGGFNFIDTDIIRLNPKVTKPYLASIAINNKPFSQCDEKECNTQYIPDIIKLKVPHNLNTFTFRPTSSNYLKTHNNAFKYRLKGYDSEFKEIPAQQGIIYVKIPPGHYTFELYCSNNDDVWFSEPYLLELYISAPIYFRWYSMLIYLLIIAIVAYYLIRYNIDRIKLRQEINRKQYQNEMNESAHNEKVKLFVNISHELRTPLNLITAPLSVLEQNVAFSKESKMHLSVIRRNTDRLLKLINQILDFRMLELGELTPVFKSTNIITLCNQVCSYFEYNINENHIKFSIEKSASKIINIVDADLLEKSVYNLVSNAMRHTPNGGSIKLSIQHKEVEEPTAEEGYSIGKTFKGNALEISVENQGEGIAKENIPLIFDRFFKSDDHKASSGIGLHLCQEYVRLHNGYILVRSIENKTTTFTIRIPSDNARSEQEEVGITKQQIGPTDKESHQEQAEPSDTSNLPVIIVVEDNVDLLYYLRTLFKDHYRCITAKNGRIGYDMAVEMLPQLIISDISMPQMNGIEMINALRKNELTQNIPVILLTAHNDTQTAISAASAGADAFLTKPVDERLLQAHIEYLIANRGVATAAEPQQELITSYKSSGSFSQRLEYTVSQNINDKNFDSAKLIELLNMSRSSLHRKMKAEFNMNSSEYIREYRLKIATQLILKGMHNINEISNYVGFNSASYFCRSFKNKYGVTPLEYYTKYYREE